MAASRYFKLDGRYYEVVAKAEDQSHLGLGQIVIYREPNSNTFLCMPRTELKAKIQMQNVDWNGRLELYKKRFVGRTDIYAKRLIAKDTGKKYYVVDGPFEGGHLSKTNHYPLTDRVLMKHLSAQDNFSIGLYPMTKDNTTPFLALDIDGHNANQPWKELTSSLEKICDQYQVPYLTELSQSGKGSHVWLFFNQPLQASKARQLGDALLQATQSVDPRLPFTAFDRLFPAQDRIGGKQFGNLIAAPLEGKAMLEQRGVFVDHQWQPFENQWTVLEQVKLLDELQVDATIKKIQSRVGYRLFDNQVPMSDDLFETASNIESLLHITRANALYIEKSTLTQQELLQLKWLASFHNPQFYEAQNNRLSVHNIPRIITLFQESKQYLSIPRGLEDEIRGIATKTVWENKTIQGTPLHAVFNGELRPNQQAAYQALLRHQNGILSARTGFGKTVIAARLIAKRAVSTLILVKNKTLAEQWYQRLTTFLRIDDDPVITELTPSGRQRRKKVIGSYYGSKKNRSGLVDIATTQSLSRLKPKELTQFLAAYGMVISDEVHHDSASTFDAVIQQVSSSYLYGLSATPYRRDGHEPIIMMRFGPIRYHTEAIDPVYAKTVHRVVIPRFTNLGMTNLEMLNNDRTENNQAIMNDPQRDKMIIRDCKNALKENRHAIVLTNLVAHVDQLYKQLPEAQTFRIYGEFSAKQRAEEVQKIEACDGPYVILATVSTAGEGLDVPTLDTLILTMRLVIMAMLSRSWGVYTEI